MQLSQDQEQVASLIFKWLKNGCNPKFITLGGYAGTGKSTLIAYIKTQLDKASKDKIKVGFCSYTGRAVQNLKVKLSEAKCLNSRDTVSTIHGLIYKPIENSAGVIIGWQKKDTIDLQLIIVDEASMIDEFIWNDLLSYGVPILAVGDHGQLPPIRGSFNLMQKPLLRLEEIHRQEKDNPIIEVSILARKEGAIEGKQYGSKVVKYTPDDFSFSETSMELLENYKTDMLVLCGYNNTRNKLNQFIRYSLGFETIEPQSGDRVICLRNNHKKGVYNGMLGTIKRLKRIDDQWYDAEIIMDDLGALFNGRIYAPQFGSPDPINFTKDRIKVGDGDLFDFGYALTVHKAQGSQAKKVVLFEERFSKMDDDQWRRWLYTAVTRAEEELYMFGV